MTTPDEKLTTADLAGRGDRPEDEPLGRDDTRADAEPTADRLEPLLGGDEAARFRADWESIQVGFVDEPRTSVERADALVAGGRSRALATATAGMTARARRRTVSWRCKEPPGSTAEPHPEPDLPQSSRALVVLTTGVRRPVGAGS